MKKLALVTGASTGFGKGLVTGLLAKDWVVVATMRDAARRQDIFDEEKKAHGDRLHIVALDVADATERSKAAVAVSGLGGRLDLLVNNAGYGLFGPFEEATEEQLRRQFEVNFFGAALLTKALLPALRAAKGKVLNVSSILGLTAFPLASSYCASKFALEGLSESLAFELEPHGVQVCAVEPGGFRTRFNDNMAWTGSGGDPASPYAAQLRGYRALREKLKAKRGTPPERVVELMVRLAEARRIPRRVLVGKDAVGLNLLESVLPDEWSRRVLGFVYGKALSRGGEG